MGENNVKQLSMYLSRTLKTIFDCLNDVLKHDGASWRMVSFDGNDFISESLGPDGTIDEKELYRHVGKVADCNPFMKDRLLAEFIHNHVSFAAIETVESLEDDKVANWCYFVTHRKDLNKVESILSELNYPQEKNQMDPVKFRNDCVKKGISIVGVSNIEPEVFELMMQQKSLNFPFCVIQGSSGFYHLRVGIQDGRKAREAVLNSAILCSANTRRMLLKEKQERDERLHEAAAKVMDNRRSYIIMNADSPEHYIRTDSNGFKAILNKDGIEYELECIGRSHPDYQLKAYGVLQSFQEFAIISAADPDASRQMQQAIEHTKMGRKRDMIKTDEKEAGIYTKVEFYKRSFLKYIQKGVEQNFLGRLKDNEVRFKAAIDHAVMIGDSVQAGDLKGDLSLNGRALSGFVRESSIDLSDLNGEAFKQQFCEIILGTSMIADPLDKKTVENDMELNIRVNDLSQESKEVKMAVLDEIRQTIHEVGQMDYEFTEISLEQLAREAESKENALEGLFYDDREIE